MLAIKRNSCSFSVVFARFNELCVFVFLYCISDLRVDILPIEKEMFAKFDYQRARVLEYVCQLRNLCLVLFVDLFAIGDRTANLLDRLAKLINTFCNLATFKLFSGLFEVFSKRVDIFDTV